MSLLLFARCCIELNWVEVVKISSGGFSPKEVCFMSSPSFAPYLSKKKSSFCSLACFEVSCFP
jgi:hypothetical protein